MKAFNRGSELPFTALTAGEGVDDEPTDDTLEGLTQEELLVLRQKLDARLVNQRLADINLERELVLQFSQTKLFLAKIIDDKSIPANQRAQAINSCSSILAQLIKMQTDLYSAERLKAMESACVKAMKTMAPEAQEVFLSRYSDYYKNNEHVGSDLSSAPGAPPGGSLEQLQPGDGAGVGRAEYEVPEGQAGPV